MITGSQYYTLKNVLHALCNAHYLRGLQALTETEKEVWARKMRRLLRCACHAANLARDRDAPLLPRLIALIERCCEATVTEGFAFHEALPSLAGASDKRCRRGRKPCRAGHNLLLRMHGRKRDVLRFLFDPTMPFTNNQAERNAGMMKLRQKISGGFRSVAAAANFAVIHSVLSTARKQGWNILHTLTANPASLIAELQVR